MREVDLKLEKKQFQPLKGLFIRSNQAVFILSISVALVILVTISFVEPESNAYLKENILVSLFLLPFFGLTGIRTSSLIGMKYVVQGRFFDDVLRMIVFLFFIGFVLVFYNSEKVTSAFTISIHLLSAVIAFAAGSIYFNAAY